VQITSLTLLATQSIPTGSQRSASRASRILVPTPSVVSAIGGPGGMCIKVAK
jgi:hypothetical protein